MFLYNQLSRLYNGIKNFFSKNAKTCIEPVTNNSSLFDPNFTGFFRYSRKKKDLILYLLLVYYLYEENKENPFCFYLIIQLEKEKELKPFFYGKFTQQSLEGLLFLLNQDEKLFRNMNSFHSYYNNKKLEQILKKLSPIMEYPKRPMERRRIGVGYRDKGSTKLLHEKIFLPNDIGLQYNHLEKRRKIRRIQEILNYISNLKRMEDMEQSKFEFQFIGLQILDRVIQILRSKEIEGEKNGYIQKIKGK